MSTESKNRILHSGVAAGALAGLGLLPGAAKAQAVVDIAAALEPTSGLPNDVDSPDDIAPDVTVRTREVAGDVPWMTPAPVSQATDGWVAPAEPQPLLESQLSQSFAEEAVALQLAQTEFPLIEVTDSVGDTTLPVFDRPSELVAPESVTSAPVISELALASNPAASEFADSGPVASEPVASEFADSGPVASEPVASEPVASEFADSGPVASEPVASEPAASDLVASESAASEPVASAPVISVPVAVPQTLYQPETPLIAQIDEETLEVDAEPYESVVSLIALAEDTEEEEAESSIPLLASVLVRERPETVSPYLAIALTEQQQAAQSKVPWLASSLILIDADDATVGDDLLSVNLSATSGDEDAADEDLLSVNLSATDDEDADEDLLSVNLSATDDDEDAADEDLLSVNLSATSDDDDAADEDLLSVNLSATDDDEKTSPWLAIANEDEDEESEDTRLSISLPEQQPERLDPRLSISLPEQNSPKRPANWTSVVLEELIGPDEPRPSVAILSPSVGNSPRVYDVTNLQDVAITPVSLAEANEETVSVTASQVEFLSPEPNAFLEIPATSVVLRFPVGANIALLANGQLVDASLVGRTETNTTTQLRTQSWYGVVLNAGDNLLEIISTETGEILRSLPLTVKGLPDRLVLLTPRAIPSDGRSTSTVRGQFLDESGNISIWETVATLRASDGEFLGADQDPDIPGYQVEVREGEFVAELQSSLESRLVQIQASSGGFEAFSQIQFVTPQRPHLISGVVDVRLGARGTDYYESFRDFLPLDQNNRYELDVDAAAFATGNLGEWLYTGAYNSERSLNENCRGEATLFRSGGGGCENSYATYGDDSQSDVVAPSLDSVYLRIERNSPSNLGIDYAMWGDFNTEEFSTAAQLFTATNRQLHGFKASYNFGDLVATGFYANHLEGFQRDTIAPDGTSGFYFTSQRNVIPGSESVFIELEELERPGTVLERQQLARGTDYAIDYDRGTLLFNDPVTRTSVNDFGDLLVRRIVATYQYENGSDTSALAGRLQYSLNRQQGQESWLGASYFNENQGTRDFSLYGADTRIALGPNAQLTAEVAHSSSNFATTGNVNGNAYRVEVEGGVGNITGQAFFRSTDAGFTNAATTSFVAGQTRYGAQLTGQLGNTTSLRARYDREDNRGVAPRVVDLTSLLSGIGSTDGTPTDNSLTTYSLGVTQQLGNSTAEVDWIHRDRTDRLSSDRNIRSDQLRSRLTVPLGNNLSVVAQNELNLSSTIDPIYPSRTLVGLNWQAMPGINVGLNQIFYGGGGNSRGNATSLDITGEHTFASDTTVRGRFSTVDARQIGGSIGLEQGIQLGPGLALDLGYERVFSTFGNETAASTQFSQPVATGNGAAALGLAGGESYSVGLSYTDNPDFQASGRFEHRTSARGSNTVFNLSALGRVSPELTVLGDYRMAHAANQGIQGLGTSSLLKLGLAYRNPEDDRFNGLLRYEHRVNPNSLPTSGSLATSTETQEHLLSAEAIYAPNWRWELYGKYALRNSRTDIGAASNTFSSSSTVQLAQARATYRLGYQWDVVGEARWLGGSGFNETGFSVEAGYYPLPDLRLSAGYSGGATDTDFGENRSAGGFYIGATAKLSGLLNGFGTRPSAPPQQQESVISVSDESATATVNTLDETVVNSDSGSTVVDRYPTATEF